VVVVSLVAILPTHGGLQGGGARDDLNELAGDDGLACPVEGDRQLFDHLACTNPERIELSQKQAASQNEKTGAWRNEHTNKIYRRKTNCMI
jgi:hypothetical protein